MELIRKETDNINKFLFFEEERILGQLFILLNEHLLGSNNVKSNQIRCGVESRSH